MVEFVLARIDIGCGIYGFSKPSPIQSNSLAKMALQQSINAQICHSPVTWDVHKQ